MDSTKYQKFAAILFPYSIAVSSLYLFGYWGSFDVNIFEYIGISDVIKITIYHLAYYGMFIVIGTLIGNMIVTERVREAMPPGGGAHLREAKYFRAFFWVLSVLLVLLLIYTIFFTVNEYKWTQVAAISMSFIPYFIGEAELFDEVIPSRPLRVSLTNIMAGILVWSYAWGVNESVQTKKSDNFVYLNLDLVEKTYVGKGGDYFFLWDANSESIEAISSNEVSSLKYKVAPVTAVFDIFITESEEKPNKS